MNPENFDILASTRDSFDPILGQVGLSDGPPDLPSVTQTPVSRKTRVTMLTSLHYEIHGEQPRSSLRTPYVELLETEEQAYERTLSVGVEWTPIDFGWVKDTGCSFINIKNVYSAKRRVEPTADEKQLDALHILEIGKAITVDSTRSLGGVPLEWVEPLQGLYVGQETILSPLGKLERWMIRCRMEGGRYYVFALPNDPE